jgi:hypothetical protein
LSLITSQRELVKLSLWLHFKIQKSNNTFKFHISIDTTSQERLDRSQATWNIYSRAKIAQLRWPTSH